MDEEGISSEMLLLMSDVTVTIDHWLRITLVVKQHMQWVLFNIMCHKHVPPLKLNHFLFITVSFEQIKLGCHIIKIQQDIVYEKYCSKM